MKEKDEEIITLLKENSRLSITEMSKILGIPDTTIHYRMKKLDDIIKKYTIVLDYEKMGSNIYLLRIEIEKYVLNKVTKEIVENIYNDLSKKEGLISIFKSEENIFVVMAAEDLEINEFRYPGVKNVEYYTLESFEII